jgi:hypothetical protein
MLKVEYNKAFRSWLWLEEGYGFLFLLFVCFLAGYERNEFLLLTTLTMLVVLLWWAFYGVLLLCNGFGWMSIKEGDGVEDKYQELFRWKQLSIFWVFFSREAWKFLGSWLWWKEWMPCYENCILLREVMQIPLHHIPLLERCSLEAKLGVND